MVTLTRMYDKSLVSNKVFLMKRLFDIKMIDESLVAKHLNNFHIMMNKLCSIGIKFDDEIRARSLLTSLLDYLDGLVKIMSNSSGYLKLNFNDVIRLLLNEDV